MAQTWLVSLVTIVSVKLVAYASEGLLIFVSSPIYGIHSFELPFTANLDDLCQLIHARFDINDIEPSEMHLVYGGIDITQTHDKQALLSDIGISAQSHIELIIIKSSLKFNVTMKNYLSGQNHQLITDIPFVIETSTHRWTFLDELHHEIRTFMMEQDPQNINDTTSILINLIVHDNHVMDDTDICMRQMNVVFRHRNQTDTTRLRLRDKSLKHRVNSISAGSYMFPLFYPPADNEGRNIWKYDILTSILIPSEFVVDSDYQLWEDLLTTLERPSSNHRSDRCMIM